MLFRLELDTRIGIMAMRLISNPIHTPNHELADITIMVLNITINKNIIFDKFLIIKKKDYSL